VLFLFHSFIFWSNSNWENYRMSSLALRQQPDFADDIQEAAIESLEGRIIRTLEQTETTGEGVKDLVFVRSQCMIATMLVGSHVAPGHDPIEVVCPVDELRRAQVHKALRRGQPDQITLYPVTEEGYQQFLEHVGGGKRGYGEHIAYVLTHLGWDAQ
jgi:hypothetical protein